MFAFCRHLYWPVLSHCAVDRTCRPVNQRPNSAVDKTRPLFFLVSPSGCKMTTLPNSRLFYVGAVLPDALLGQSTAGLGAATTAACSPAAFAASPLQCSLAAQRYGQSMVTAAGAIAAGYSLAATKPAPAAATAPITTATAVAAMAALPTAVAPGNANGLARMC